MYLTHEQITTVDYTGIDPDIIQDWQRYEQRAREEIAAWRLHPAEAMSFKAFVEYYPHHQANMKYLDEKCGKYAEIWQASNFLDRQAEHDMNICIRQMSWLEMIMLY